MKSNITKNIIGFGMAACIILGAAHFGLIDIPSDINYYENIGNSDNIKSNNTLLKLKEDAKRKEIENSYSVPFNEDVTILHDSDNASILGTINLLAVNTDTVFIIRDSFDNKIVAIVQAPINNKIEFKLPVGRYKIQFAQNEQINNAKWQGLDKFWEYGTSFHESLLRHEIGIHSDHYGGYTVHGTGIIVGKGENKPIDISKDEFTN